MSTGLKVFAWLMVLWNGIGVAAFFSQLMMTPEMIAQLPEAQQAAYRDIPVWSYSAYALAVFGGLTGSILLALGKKLAFPVLVISLAGVIVQQYYNFVVIDAISIMGWGIVVMPVIVTSIALLLVLISQRGVRAGWLH
ncbi:MAG TPA: hypothetical protein DGF36_05310 [Alteromonas sp.]|nr:hypothetical protein [Alteromonas sp.]HCB09437.1 hypothetical protein [Alteromonas sp.]HCB15562.1 hypothetical protein [Alteromonas sp.]HCL12119.1 hypothetical protein [Alteromonas sp.]HCV17524.1 hypothetical protein [Alteromonas sp.]|tara:strand:+ start:4731 stop:5144 length:414 start_codon:yes stop_codon:yes gene_type:complete